MTTQRNTSNATLRCLILACFVFFILLAGRLSAQCPGSPNPDDTFYADAIGQYTPQQVGNRASYFKVSRVVGPGTPEQFLTIAPNSPGGNLANWQSLVNNGILSATACVPLVATVSVDPSFYIYKHFIQGDGPVDLTVTVDFTLNGVYIGDQVKWTFAQISTSDPFSASNTQFAQVPTNLFRFAQLPSSGSLLPTTVSSGSSTNLRDAPRATSGPACFPAPGEYNCPGINEFQKYLP